MTLSRSLPRGKGEPVPLEDWDWREIVRLERLAVARALRGPRCQKCGKPMVLRQSDTHYTCRESWQQ
jgi:hypothetical protein